MAHTISVEEGKKKLEYYIESQKLNQQGIKPKLSRAEKKRRKKLSKTERFILMLKDRGGYFEQKKKS